MVFRIAFEKRVTDALEKQAEAATQTAAATKMLAEESAKQTEYLGQIAKQLRRAFPPNSARNLVVYFVRELPMDKIVFKLKADPPDTDVVKRELTLLFGAGTSDESTVVVHGTKDTVVFDKFDDGETEIQGPQDSTVDVTLVDIDDAGLRADPTTLPQFTLVDVFAPVAATGLGVEFVREIEGG